MVDTEKTGGELFTQEEAGFGERAEIVQVEDTGGAIVPMGDPESPAALLRLAIERGCNVDQLEKLVGLAERMDDRKAAKEFAAALAKFHEECPPIVARTENTQFKVTRDGRPQNRLYATLQDISKAIRHTLARNGITVTWGNTDRDGDNVSVKCIASHTGGHKQEASATFPCESKAGASPQQKVGSAITYAQRYSLIAVLGLTSCDDDDDGRGIGPLADKITPEQLVGLDNYIKDVGANLPAFVAFFKIDTLADLPLAEYGRAIQMLDGKYSKQKDPAAKGVANG